jgi:outer membrane protein OmpA-like peptidoglycan-associated protein
VAEATTTSTTIGIHLTESTLPDGRPVAVMAVFDDEWITLTGTVPTESAAAALERFALEFSLSGATVVDNLTIDPAASTSGGVRVVELNSVHFSGDSAVITAGHAQQLDRIAQIMIESPATRLHVVGNTDQHGDETRNYVVSQRRAEAVADYLATRGVDRSRITTQPAGESNPLSTQSGAEADALNRRTEYVFYGLFG